MDSEFRLIISCPDRVGIVAEVSSFIASYGGWINEASHYSDPVSGWFFMRHCIRSSSLPFGIKAFKDKFSPIAEKYKMKWSLFDSSMKKRIVLMASRESHCLVDLLHRWHSKELYCDIRCVISNHEHLKRLVDAYGAPYHFVPTSRKSKENAFERIIQLVEDNQADLIVLARYMQILPGDICDTYQNRIINIHHSFLPSFVGAKPYHQASERGVKLIGATCHYVTEALDAGPIIDQDVMRITHHNTVEDMIRLGRDVEKLVLARGVRSHLEDRVLVHGNKTIVF
ncbi:formyltetrahydrofolate deformylase [Nitrosococcus oceani ATCC 19707]|uniref:Formyltetrahydrofolate deformylase n=2 Tax=Nitrosococcus oceani TaxID=1229 RepID=Q3JA86_NITOC|nr:formyltetrahydrofolate deformylase [Nitrosococcus oceani]ABA58260.1 formyltetrahydrofolate deformylase [Nitrosococcus oceani ATCC 19707]EDZ68474.1 formyltetrahydrofolate deformylase [Nitrosococcus oceani AFC27]KFI19298.1 formyltetrahydrofolate deformylase [Nitrosococcus oceani C-27]GEM20482.1 formyltetrahydrofolate deformylase [Nitrosococcus oceani]